MYSHSEKLKYFTLSMNRERNYSSLNGVFTLSETATDKDKKWLVYNCV